MTALLSLVQWLSPAFPTGGFAYSHGLEFAISNGDVSNADQLRQWLSEVLRYGAGRQDAILLACGLRAGADFDALDALARALATSEERLRETADQGRAFAQTAGAITHRAAPPRTLPIAVAEAAAPLGLPPAQTIALYLHSFAANLCGAAMRFMPLGQTEGQRVLADLHPLIQEIASFAAKATPEDLGSCAFGADLAAMHHETMDIRIFRT